MDDVKFQRRTDMAFGLVTEDDTPYCRGDFGRDGGVDGADLAVLVKEYGRTDCYAGGGCRSDMNYDGKVDNHDLAVFAADPPYPASYLLFGGFWYTLDAGALTSSCPADFEPDGDVDEDDLVTLAADFGLSGVGRDADGDMDMDGLDLYPMAIDFNRIDCLD